MKLRDILKPIDLQKTQRFFNFDVGNIPCEWGKTDGQFNRMASAKSNSVFSSNGKIIFDPVDWPRHHADFDNMLIREVLLHELVHIEQYRRGIAYRFKMKYWNRTMKYEERPHEKEAHQRGKQLAQIW